MFGATQRQRVPLKEGTSQAQGMVGLSGPSYLSSLNDSMIVLSHVVFNVPTRQSAP